MRCYRLSSAKTPRRVGREGLRLRCPVLEKVVGPENVDVSYAMLSGRGAHMKIFQVHSPFDRSSPGNKPVSDPGITPTAFHVEKIDDLYQSLKSQGMRFNSPLLLVREGVRTAYFHDPDGVTLEMIEYAHVR